MKVFTKFFCLQNTSPPTDSNTFGKIKQLPKPQSSSGPVEDVPPPPYSSLDLSSTSDSSSKVQEESLDLSKENNSHTHKEDRDPLADNLPMDVEIREESREVAGSPRDENVLAPRQADVIGKFLLTSACPRASLIGMYYLESVAHDMPAPVTTITVAMAEDSDVPCSSKSLPEVSLLQFIIRMMS